MSEEGFDLGKSWAKVRPVDRWVYGTVVLLVVLAAVCDVGWRSLDTPLWIGVEVEESGADLALDPWGQNLRRATWAGEIGMVEVVWSVGPNGVDEEGQGDDVVALAPDHPRFRLFRLAPVGLLMLGLGLAGVWSFLVYLQRPRKEGLGPEVFGSALLALPVAMLLSVVGILGVVASGGAADTLRQQLVIPLPLALIGSAYACSFLLVLWIRLGRPLEGAEGDGLATSDSPKENEGSGR